MKETFRTVRLHPESLAIVNTCDGIIAQYSGQGLRLTLRQLYYQLVTRNVIINEEKSYRRLGGIVSDARLSGLLDWDAIEDRVRQPWEPLEFQDINHRIESALANYRLPRWEGQPNYVELWVEKDALAGVLRPLASEFHVTLMVNRGYSSQSAMYESANRFRIAVAEGKNPILFYLGDHDPSGEDMVRDIRDRLIMFGIDDIDVRKLALTTAQVQQYKPPPNPAKVDDPRAAAYIEKHGPVSWEVDALDPATLSQIITDAFRDVRDPDLVDRILDQEEADKRALRKALKNLTRA